jgi:hypothetical protein
MRMEEEPNEPDPTEVQPTDNSSGVPVDLERLEEVQEESQTAGT